MQTMKQILPFGVACVAAMAVAGCASTTTDSASAPAAASSTSTVASAAANLSAASGSLVSGQLKLMPMGDGVHVTGTVGGLAPNSTHAFHIHEKGDCTAADASSAGGHFNPTAQPHGRVTGNAHHAGDADNVVANAEGVATINAHFSGVVLGGAGSNNAIGKGVIVHADPDDYTSQPSGNAGARIACGVIEAG